MRALLPASLALLLAFPPLARAQQAPAAPDVISPPVLKDHPEATYPPGALRDRIEATVGLEITVDESGHVVDARLTRPAGHGFDDAALAAVKRWTFDPAKKSGQPIPSTIQLAFPFHLPPAESPPASPASPTALAPGPAAATAQTPAPPIPRTPTPATAPAAPAPPTPAVGPAPATPASPEITQQGETTVVVARRPLAAASSVTIADRDFTLRPIGSAQDILRVTPGLVIVQHSGGGKAGQYFLRGFDADHGTDLALSIDGIPINMVSHAHGQGFADTNFIIPETVERLEITKGPYFASQGDFATAGALNFVTRDDFEHSSLGFGFGGSPGHGAPSYRGLLVASPHLGDTKAFFAAEVGRQNGPFDNPEAWDHYKLFNKVTFALGTTSALTVGESSYSGNWRGSGQIPARAVESGLVSRFGAIDPTEGGNTARHQIFVAYSLRPTEQSEIHALAYLGTYRFDLFSNFTLYRDDPENGDEIQQIDRRAFYGGKLTYRLRHDLRGVRFATTLGADVRSDDIHEELWHTRQRTPLSATRGDDVHETMTGAYVDEEITPVRWLRLDLGGRADLLSFSVDDTLHRAGSGSDAAHQFSPKASLVVTPLDARGAHVDLYANYGDGFHSNDVRGAFAVPAVTPMTRAVGEELGARTRLLDRIDLTAAVWRLTLDHETVWNGDEGTTAVSDPTLRYGVELGARYEITHWLVADGNVTFTHSQFSTDRENGGGLALAPKQTWSGGLSARHELGPGVAGGGLRFFGIGDRPASDDGQLVAPGFTQVDAHLGYRHRRFDFAFDVENLLNGQFRSAQFATVSRLRTEPGIGAAVPAGFTCGSGGRLAPNPATGGAGGRFWGCEDVSFTPAYPITLRLMATVFLD